MCGGVVSAVNYQQEFLYDIRSEMEPLIEKDWQEVGSTDAPLNVDWEAYFLLEDTGKLKTFTARKNGDLIGYFLTISFNSLQSKGHTLITNDAIYVDPDHRGIGKHLFTFVERCLREDGHDSLIVTTTERYRIDRFLECMGYNKIETRFKKVL